MKLSKYIKELQKLAKKYPNATVISASDEEGNEFSKVQYVPTEGYFKDGEFETDEGKINAVCVN